MDRLRSISEQVLPLVCTFDGSPPKVDGGDRQKTTISRPTEVSNIRRLKSFPLNGRSDGFRCKSSISSSINWRPAPSSQIVY